ncbi:hypothetical protein [Deefgea sp. CFH1-16]|uniref:hypothetical protein n=1 Tax=Deefgea sp. CFH1-16 TaxID=2675457 RepID=UPI0015F39506|nr:hypothetical protein [Deefgea sp. CFH1-16]MBM5575794.1 hypothetical protein [Deefgea sp. CFH1-16]
MRNLFKAIQKYAAVRYVERQMRAHVAKGGWLSPHWERYVSGPFVSLQDRYGIEVLDLAWERCVRSGVIGQSEINLKTLGDVPF